jgi:hypothetical protein
MNYPARTACSIRARLGLGGFANALRPTVESAHRIAALEPELRHKNDAIAIGLECSGYDLFVDERLVGFGRIEKRDASFDGGTGERDRRVSVGGGSESRSSSPRSGRHHFITPCAARLELMEAGALSIATQAGHARVRPAAFPRANFG